VEVDGGDGDGDGGGKLDVMLHKDGVPALPIHAVSVCAIRAKTPYPSRLRGASVEF